MAAALFPAVKAGLHCGENGPIPDGLTIDHLFPAVKAGLHCGEVTYERADTPVILFPAVKAGLHCGAVQSWESGIDGSNSSRP